MRLVHETTPTVVIAELSLERGGGLELIKQIAALKNAPRIVVCSLHDEQVFAVRAIRAGARGYVPKQEASEHIVKAVEQVLAGKIFVNAAILQQLQKGAVSGKQGDTTSPLDKLTDRELEVFEAIGGGLSIHQIAANLFLSAKTVETYRDRTKRKLNLRSSANLLCFAVRWSSDQSRRALQIQSEVDKNGKQIHSLHSNQS